MIRELWHLAKAGQDIRCGIRAIPDLFDPDVYFGLELRLDRNGELYLTELHRDRQRLAARVGELHGLLTEKGWQVPAEG